MKKALIVTFILFGLSTYSHFTKTSFSFIKGIFAATCILIILKFLFEGRSLLSSDDDYESTTDSAAEEVIIHQVIFDCFYLHSLLIQETTVEQDAYVDDEGYDNVSLSSDCIKPEITHFPDPLINKDSRQHGAIILHILLAIYMFIGRPSLHC